MKKVPPILYAEDNEHDAELTITAFNRSDITNPIQVVRDGQEVLDYLYENGQWENQATEKPVLIILDLKMPRIDGLGALKKIKSDENLITIPVIMLSSSDIESDLKNCYQYGANAYVVKPIDYSEFMEAVKNISNFWVSLNKTIDNE